MNRVIRTRPAEVDRLVQAISRRTGLAFDGTHRRWMAEAIDDWWRRSGSASVSEQLARLEYDPATWDRLVDRLTIRETYFFRQHGQLQEISEVIAGAAPPSSSDYPRASTGPAAVRVWSAGCASGEEPYSLAILLDRAGALDQCRIVATDLSRAAIEAARSATYGSWSRRGDAANAHARYFRPDGDRVRLEPRISHAVRFVQHNLLDGPPDAAGFDVIVCRHVLLHLQPEARHRTARVLRGALRPGGWLFVGASDPVPPIDGLVPVVTDHGLAFRLVDGGPRARTPRRASPDLEPRPQPRPLPDPDPGSGAASGPGPSVAGAGGTGGPAGRAIDEASLDPALRCGAAALHLHAGRVDEAVAEARAAVDLERSSAMAHLLLGRAELARGNADRARRSFTNALELLRGLPPGAEVPLSDGTPAGRLAATARALATVGPT